MSPAVQSPHVPERRSAFGDVFLRTFVAADRPLTFDDLAKAARGSARYSEVVGWIAAAMAAGLVEDAGFDVDADGRPRGPRRFTLTPTGRRRLSRDRRRFA